MEILEAIQGTAYLSESEIYSKDELDNIRNQSSQITDELILELYKEKSEIHW